MSEIVVWSVTLLMSRIPLVTVAAELPCNVIPGTHASTEATLAPAARLNPPGPLEVIGLAESESAQIEDELYKDTAGVPVLTVMFQFVQRSTINVICWDTEPILIGFAMVTVVQPYPRASIVPPMDGSAASAAAIWMSAVDPGN